MCTVKDIMLNEEAKSKERARLLFELSSSKNTWNKQNRKSNVHNKRNFSKEKSKSGKNISVTTVTNLDTRKMNTESGKGSNVKEREIKRPMQLLLKVILVLSSMMNLYV